MEGQLKQYIEVFRESLSLFSTSALKKWIVIVIITSSFFTPIVGGGDPVGKLLGVAGSVGYMFATGIPFIVGASLLFSSQETQRNIVDSKRKSGNIQFALLFIPYAVMTMLVMALVVLIGFVFIVPSLPPLQIFGFLSSLLVSTFVVLHDFTGEINLLSLQKIDSS